MIRIAVCVLAQAVAVSAVAAPNVILCMADDQGWGDVGYNGHPHLKTPHLDRMSAEGVTFTRFYSAAAMCSPTRGSCYTGRNPYRFGITFAMKGRLEATEVPLSTVLKKRGYATGHFGKWHLGTLSKKKGDQKRWGAFAGDPVRYFCPPWERDVDVCFVTESKTPTWNPLLDPGPLKGKNKGKGKQPAAANSEKPYGNDYFSGPGQTVTENTLGDDSRVIMDRAIPFIQDAVKKKQPFLAVIWFHAPHSPVVGGPDYLRMYADQPEPARHYYACLTALDEQVGRLRAELKRLQVDGDTMLWFCSDNGPARQGSPRHVGSNGGLSGYKLSIREGGIRVPGLLVWPNEVKKPRTVDAPCVTSDYSPTILDALKIPIPEGRVLDGVSMLPLIRGERATRDAPIGFLNKDGKESVWMEDRYKLIETSKSAKLYD
ncbi:MAG: sulfatase-like hydrolase/transferase, partial [Planctomycetales bacterium]